MMPAANIFQRMREGFTSLGQGSDGLSLKLREQVERATSEYLVGADWGLNMEIVDMVNSAPAESNSQEKVVRTICQRLRRTASNPKVDILALTLIETLVLNCGPRLHEKLAFSETWYEIQRMADPKKRLDLAVKDKVLTLIQTWGQSLHPTQFREFYEHLLDQGVRFPVRSATETVPVHMPQVQAPPPPVHPSPPPMVHTQQAQHAQHAQHAHQGSGGLVGGIDEATLAGMSDEDRAAVLAAMDDLQATEPPPPAYSQQAQMPPQQHAPPYAAPTPVTAPAPAPLAPPRSRGGYTALPDDIPGDGAYVPPAPVLDSPHAAQAAPPASHLPTYGQVMASAGAAQTQQTQQEYAPPPVMSATEKLMKDLETATDTVGLFKEVLAGIPDASPEAVKEDYIADIGAQCEAMRPKLETLISGAEDEAVLATALSLHDDLQAALKRYMMLLQAATLPVSTAADTHSLPPSHTGSAPQGLDLLSAEPAVPHTQATGPDTAAQPSEGATIAPPPTVPTAQPTSAAVRAAAATTGIEASLNPPMRTPSPGAQRAARTPSPEVSTTGNMSHFENPAFSMDTTPAVPSEEHYSVANNLIGKEGGSGPLMHSVSNLSLGGGGASPAPEDPFAYTPDPALERNFASLTTSDMLPSYGAAQGTSPAAPDAAPADAFDGLFAGALPDLPEGSEAAPTPAGAPAGAPAAPAQPGGDPFADLVAK